MKLLKNIVLSVFMAVSVVGVSSTAFAESDPGRITYKPTEAIDMVVAKIKEGQDAIAAGKLEDAAALLKTAKNLGKEINANDVVDAKRQRASIHISKAIGMLKEKDAKEAANHLNEATEAFIALKKDL